MKKIETEINNGNLPIHLLSIIKKENSKKISKSKPSKSIGTPILIIPPFYKSCI